jgi:hypothetical protein
MAFYHAPVRAEGGGLRDREFSACFRDSLERGERGWTEAKLRGRARRNAPNRVHPASTRAD